MDGGATVIAASGNEVVQLDRGIYASDRSPMGVGYRLIASSAGITAEEKRAIVRCAPSQGNLCEDGPDATGLASFPLSSGRQAVLLSRHAGIEATARGGYNVLTHVLVLDQDDFALIGWDPFVVAQLTLAQLGDEIPTNSVARLEPLPLACPLDDVSTPLKTPDVSLIKPFITALAALLERTRTLITGVAAAPDVLRWLVQATPAALRQGLSLSYGMKYTRARQFDLVLADPSPTEIKRVASDGDLNVLDWHASVQMPNASYQAWLQFVQTSCKEGCFHEAAQLANEITTECSADSLARVTQIVADLEHVPTAERELLSDLTLEHLGHAASIGVPRRLLDELKTAIADRRTQLDEIEAAEREAAEQAAADQAVESPSTSQTPLDCL